MISLAAIVEVFCSTITEGQMHRSSGGLHAHTHHMHIASYSIALHCIAFDAM